MPLSPMYPPQERREEAPPSPLKSDLFFGTVWLGIAALDQFQGRGFGMAIILAVGALVSAFAYWIGLRPRNRLLAGLAWYGIAFAFCRLTGRG